MYERAVKKNKNAAKFQLRQPESHPIQLIDNKMAHQKVYYIHYNPVEAGFVTKAEDWIYSSAIDSMGQGAFRNHHVRQFNWLKYFHCQRYPAAHKPN